MEEIYANIDTFKPTETKPSSTGLQRSAGWVYRGTTVCLGLLSVLLLCLLIHIHVTYRASSAELSAINANLTELLQTSNEELSAMTAERDLLNASLTNATEELHRPHTLSTQKKACQAGWRMFSCACYFLSNQSDSWEKGRQDCREKEADLVVVDDSEEQEFLSKLIKNNTWIGLNDKDTEGSWKWTDRSPLTQSFWSSTQPDNGGGDPKWGEEDCVHLGVRTKGKWNDLRCENHLQWICEKMP